MSLPTEPSHQSNQLNTINDTCWAIWGLMNWMEVLIRPGIALTPGHYLKESKLTYHRNLWHTIHSSQETTSFVHQQMSGGRKCGSGLECRPSRQKPQVWALALYKQGMVVRGSILELQRTQGHPWLHRDLKNSLGCHWLSKTIKSKRKRSSDIQQNLKGKWNHGDCRNVDFKATLLLGRKWEGTGDGMHVIRSRMVTD